MTFDILFDVLIVGGRMQDHYPVVLELGANEYADIYNVEATGIFFRYKIGNMQLSIL